MRIRLPDEHEMLRESVRAFARDTLWSGAVQADAVGRLDPAHLKIMAELGLFGIALPESAGGAGMDALALVVALEEIAAGSASAASMLASHHVAVLAAWEGGMLGLHGRDAEAFAAGRARAAFAPAHDGEGGLRARPYPGGCRLHGNTPAVAGLRDADAVLAAVGFASDEAGGVWWMDADGAGVATASLERPLGLRAAGLATLRCEESDVALRAGQAARRANLRALALARFAFAAVALGVGARALEAALAHARGREQFGKPIAEFQGVQWPLADSATELDAVRLVLWRAAAFAFDEGAAPDFARLAATAHALAAQAAVTATYRAIQVHGGYGYLEEFPVERPYRDAVMLASLLPAADSAASRAVAEGGAP